MHNKAINHSQKNMCAHYENVQNRSRLQQHFGVAPPDDLGKVDIWPSGVGLAIRRPPELIHGDDAVASKEVLQSTFGLIPHWATDSKIAKNTYNARTETVAVKPSFRDAWKRAQRCIILAEAIYEPDWRSGKAVATRISRADAKPMGIAGLWSSWRSPAGEWIHSHTMLTINADTHPIMSLFHKPTDEKRMVVILEEKDFDGWLDAPIGKEFDYLLGTYRQDNLCHTPYNQETTP